MKTISEALAYAKRFTAAYQAQTDILLREVECMRAQYPAILDPIGPDDLYVGYYEMPLVGYCYSWSSDIGTVGYFADPLRLREIAENMQLCQADRDAAKELLEYWADRRTFAKIRAAHPHINEGDVKFLTEIYVRLAEINLDFDMLLRLGLPGLGRELTRMDAEAPSPVRKAELLILDLVADVLRHYAAQARSLMAAANEKRQRELSRMAEALERLCDHAPDSFYSAMLLFNLVAMMTTVDNFARMDVYLGDFLAHDLKAGVLTRDEALELLVPLYSRLGDLFPTSGRIVIAGEGRRNPENADVMALLILDAAIIVHKSAPTLSMRLYPGMNTALWDKACDALEAGCSYPLLFNDAVNIPARMRGYRVSREEAEQYIMSNCGEYGLWGRSIHSPDCAINYAKILELTLNNGVDPVSGEKTGLETGNATGFRRFDELLQAFETQCTFFIQRTAACLQPIYSGAAADSKNLLMAMLHHDSFENGTGLLEGSRYLICDIETHAVVTVADSLLAIRKVIFEEQKMSMETLLAALKANFAGYQREHALLKRAPKFGNNHPEADAMTRYVSDFIYEECAKQADRFDIQAITASQITVDGYITYGGCCGATPDGRLAGTPITNSTNPSNGSDRQGITALLSSMSGVDCSLSGGQVCHLKLTPDSFSKEKRAATSAMISVFFASGGGELSIYTVRQEDLLDAVEHPEKHENLMVRIGGYNARFITLSRPLQEEMIARNAYRS